MHSFCSTLTPLVNQNGMHHLSKLQSINSVLDMMALMPTYISLKFRLHVAASTQDKKNKSSISTRLALGKT